MKEPHQNFLKSILFAFVLWVTGALSLNSIFSYFVLFVVIVLIVFSTYNLIRSMIKGEGKVE